MASTGKQKIPFLPLTRLQRAILEEHFRKRGHGEGYQRTYQRLKLAIGDKDHYAMDDNGNIARTDDGEIYEEVDEPIKVMNQTYNYNGTDYTWPTRKRLLKGKEVIQRRKLLPTLLAIQDWLRKDPQHQIDRPTRNKPAGGVKAPPKTALKPIIPKSRPLDMLFCDSFRMPATVHNRKQVSWCIVIVDGLTRMMYLAPMYLQTNLTITTKEKAQMDEITEGFDPSKRPSSDQALKHLKEMIRKINKTRKHYADKKKLTYKGDLHPRLITTDFGSEFKGVFTQGVERLREDYKRVKNGKTTYPFYNLTRVVGRSNHNALAENSVRHVRKYFYTINTAYQNAMREWKEENDGKRIPKRWTPTQWHVGAQSSELYDWVLDIPEVLRRVNTRYETTIKTQPIKGLLQIDVKHKELYNRIVAKAKRKYKDVKHNIRLPGFDSNSPPKEGDYCRIRIHKEGNMGVTFPQQGQKRKQNTKAASNNYSKAIYKIMEVKKLNGGALTFLVSNIDPDERRASRGFLDRTALLKIPPDTILESGRTVVDEDTFLNKEKPSAPPPPPPPPSKKETRSSITKQVERLEKLSLKEWNKLVRNKQFNWDDGIRTKIIKMRSQGKKFEDWVVETKDIDDGDLGEIEFESMLELAKDEDWFQYEKFKQKVF